MIEYSIERTEGAWSNSVVSHPSGSESTSTEMTKVFKNHTQRSQDDVSLNELPQVIALLAMGQLENKLIA